MRAAIVSIGSELLDGRISDTNAQWAAGELTRRGVEVVMTLVADDAPGSMVDAFDSARERAEIVWVTGGLGATRDDMTVEALSRFLGREVEEDAPSAARIREWALRRGIPATTEMMRQARVPAGAAVFPNPVGAAPGFMVREGETIWVAMPGVPAEMRAIAETGVLPALEGMGVSRPASFRVLGVTGLPESEVDSRIRDIWEGLGKGERFALQAMAGEVRLAMTVKAGTERLDELEREVRMRLGAAVYGGASGGLEGAIVGLLRARGASVAVAESLTGGLVMARLAAVPGASMVLRGGWVAYADSAKREWLGVPGEILATRGAVSAEAARAMAEGARTRGETDFAVSTTGWAGPDGGTAENPVGTVFVGIAGPGLADSSRHWFRGGREAVRQFAATAALSTLHRLITESPR